MFVQGGFFAILRRVDSLTQAALGAAVGELLLGKKLGNRALAWGALFGTLPDLDVLISPFLSNSFNLVWHRGPSHSLLVMSLASWWLSRWLARLWKRDKVSRKQAGWFIFAAWSTHVMIDCFTVYGTAVLWPLPRREAWNHLFIIDPLYTLPLLICLVWLAFLRTKKQLKKRRKLNAWGLGLSSAYVLFSIGMKFLASSAFAADLARRGITPQRRMEAPTAFNTLLWRSVAQVEGDFWVGYHSVFEGKQKPVRWVVYPQNRQSVSHLAQDQAFRRIDSFSDGWWIARPHAKGAWIGDMRFGESLSWGAKKNTVDSQLVFAWQVLPDSPEKMRTLMSNRGNISTKMVRLFWRILGKSDRWDGTSRLDGVTGKLPEPLRFIE